MDNHPKVILAATSPAYETNWGAAYVGDSRQLLSELPNCSINLIVTSPPFALQRKKEYGNKSQSDYSDWLIEFMAIARQKLVSDGSLIIDLGGAYEKGTPVRSLYNFRLLIRLVDELGFFLAEDFYWFNPSKLPSPIEWVNKRKLRAKDSVNTVWWLSKTKWPKADVSNVLTEYSPRMRKLLEDPEKFYSAKKRPSGHDIGNAFEKNNGGAIPSNLLQIPNTDSNSQYISICKQLGISPHPARFPVKLPEFFIRFLTEPGDVILDIFGGSNTTGFAAESNGRRWLSFEERRDYVAASIFRFVQNSTQMSRPGELHHRIMNGEAVKVDGIQPQLRLLEASQDYEFDAE